jgi:FkbM family methyltransferase
MAALYFLARAPLQKLILVEANPALSESVRALFQARDLGPVEAKIENVIVTGMNREVLDFYVARDHRLSGLEPPRTDVTSFTKTKMPGIPLRDLLDRHTLPTADLLKMDIEGGEFDILDHDPQVFLRFRYICAEIHGGPESRDPFARRLGALGFKILNRQSSVYYPCEMLYAERI